MKATQEYMKRYKRIQREKKEQNDGIKAAILSSFTIKGLKEILTVEAAEEGIALEIYEGEYNQIPQEILEEQSGMRQYNPDIIFVLWDARSFFGNYYFDAYGYTVDERKEYIEEKIAEMKQWIAVVSEKFHSMIVWNNMCLPDYSPVGILDAKQEFGLIESMEYFNIQLRQQIKTKENVYLYDFNRFCAGIGYRNIQDDKMYYFGDMKVALEHMPHLAKEYMAYIRSFQGKNKKCLVLDLDNTLWGGIVGEDGIDGIKIGLHYEEKPYYEFQQYILSLYHRGIILAINSRNNEEDVMEVFRNHKYMVLKEEHFAAMRINWKDKASNLKELAQELNIGLDSMVFVDDDIVNCELVRRELPEVLTLQMPDRPEKILPFFKEWHMFDSLQFTVEDQKKNEMYAAQKKRNHLKSISLDIDAYIRSLEIKTKLYPLNEKNIQRVAQLTKKTNQFNLTTRRYTERDLQRMQEEGCLVECIEVTDKFGDNGITGVLICKYESEEKKVIVDSMILSCRVMGRKIEDILLRRVENYAREKMAKGIEGIYIATPKNKAVEQLYGRFGYKKVREEELEEGHAVYWWKEIIRKG